MEWKENIFQPPQYTAEMFSEYFESAKKRAIRASEIEAILGDNYDLGRLQELVEADRDGRCVVFKFGIGSNVYRTWIRPDGSHPSISVEKMATIQDLVNAETWPNAYKSCEAAEEALKGVMKGEQRG